MATSQIKSLKAFSIAGLISSASIGLLVFGGSLLIILPLVIFSSLFSGGIGFLLGQLFPLTGSKAKLKAMLLGAGIAALTYLPTMVLTVIAFKINFNGIDALFQINTYLSEIILTVGFGAMFSGPIILPIGAYTGLYVQNA